MSKLSPFAQIVTERTGKSMKDVLKEIGISYNLFMHHNKKGTLKRAHVHKLLAITGLTYPELFPLKGDPKVLELTPDPTFDPDAAKRGEEKIENNPMLKELKKKIDEKEQTPDPNTTSEPEKPQDGESEDYNYMY
jgi:hypothetical protein